MTTIDLSALEGGNPLGFLAALGILEATADRHPNVRLAWNSTQRWSAALSDFDGGFDDLVDLLHADRIDCTQEPALALEYDGKRDLKPPPEVFRSYLQGLRTRAHESRRDPSGSNHRRGVDWANAFGSDVVTDNNDNTKPTALHFTAGQQQFLAMANDLGRAITRDDLVEALQGPWSYTRPLPVMAWDSSAARDYALRASNPSGDKKVGVPGADWLALRGLSTLPVFPIRTRLHTTGCRGGWKTGSFTWPLWDPPLTRPVVRSLLRLRVWDLSLEERAARGISTIFTCGIRRSDQGGYGTFEPASAI